jgi:hypothetical protein
MDADTASNIALRLEENTLNQIATLFLALPSDELAQCSIEFEAMSANLSEPLGRSPMAHVALQMLRGMRRGIDPRDVAGVFSEWAALRGCLGHEDMPLGEWLEELTPRLRGGNDGE